MPVNILASTHPAIVIEGLPELTFSGLRPRDNITVVINVQDLSVASCNLRPSVSTSSIRVMINSKVGPPGLHLIIKS